MILRKVFRRGEVAPQEYMTEDHRYYIRKHKPGKGWDVFKITRVTPYNDFTDEFGKRYYKVVLNRTQKNGRNVELEVRF